MLDIASTLHGKYLDGARYIFEALCGSLIAEEWKYGYSTSFNVPKTGKVYSVAVRQGDGGLDVLHEEGSEWIVYQCKFLFKTTLGDSDIQSSFEASVATAKKEHKNIKKWILCVPKNLDNTERKYWKKFKEKNSAIVNDIDIILHDEILSALTRNEHIKNLYMHQSTSSTISHPESNDKATINSVLDRIDQDKIIPILERATAMEDKIAAYFSETSLSTFVDFVDGLDKWRKDFDDEKAFEIYSDFRRACEELKDNTKWAWAKFNPGKDALLYLGGEVHPKSGSRFSDRGVYEDRVKGVQERFTNFETAYNVLKSY